MINGDSIYGKGGECWLEEWKDIQGFPGYQVSNLGNVRTFWEFDRLSNGRVSGRHIGGTPRPVPQSDDGKGYLKVTLHSSITDRYHCPKVHRLVAETFIPGYHDGDTVDHIRSGAKGKLDNSINNLQWMPNRDNVRKAFEDGMHDKSIANHCRKIMGINIRTGETTLFPSIKEAAKELQLNKTSISHVLGGRYHRSGDYRFEYADKERD